MKRKSAPPALVPPKSHRKRGILRKAARVGATLVAARVAADTGKKGVIGLLAGAGAKRLILRYPAGAMFVTGAYMAGKLFEAKRAADAKKAQKLLPDRTGEAIPIESARKTSQR